jgi:hypothetical protein
MEVSVANSFLDSLKAINRRGSLLWKPYYLIKETLPNFFKNVWIFRKALANHEWWDHHGLLMFVETGCLHMAKHVEVKGLEIDESRLKKVAAMRRLAELIRNYNEDRYIEMAEIELGEVITGNVRFVPIEGMEDHFSMEDDLTEEQNDHNGKVYKRADEIEVAEWDEIYHLMKGQDYSLFDKEISFEKQFDGSGIKNWWD